jgi:hypothetical protein
MTRPTRKGSTSKLGWERERERKSERARAREFIRDGIPWVRRRRREKRGPRHSKKQKDHDLLFLLIPHRCPDKLKGKRTSGIAVPSLVHVSVFDGTRKEDRPPRARRSQTLLVSRGLGDLL